MKNITVILTGMFLCAVIFVGFGGQVEAKTTITFWFPGGAGQEEYFQNAVERFEAQNADIDVEVTVLPPNAADIEAP